MGLGLLFAVRGCRELRAVETPERRWFPASPVFVRRSIPTVPAKHIHWLSVNRLLSLGHAGGRHYTWPADACFSSWAATHTDR